MSYHFHESELQQHPHGEPPIAERVVGAVLAVVIGAMLAVIVFHGLSGGFR